VTNIAAIRSPRACGRIVLLATVVFVGACGGTASRPTLSASGGLPTADTAPYSPSAYGNQPFTDDLAAPAPAQNTARLSPLAKSGASFVSCQALDQATGHRLRHLALPPPGTIPRCFVEGDAPAPLPSLNDGGLQWYAHVIYLTTKADPNTLSYPELFPAGAIDIDMAFGFPHQLVFPPGDQRAFDPHHAGGGGNEQADIRGDEGVVSYVNAHDLWAVWEEPLGKKQWVRWYLTALAKPSQLISWADHLQSGPPPGVP
jgi:hypothetical protein